MVKSNLKRNPFEEETRESLQNQHYGNFRFGESTISNNFRLFLTSLNLFYLRMPPLQYLNSEGCAGHPEEVHNSNRYTWFYRFPPSKTWRELRNLLCVQVQ